MFTLSLVFDEANLLQWRLNVSQAQYQIPHQAYNITYTAQNTCRILI